MWIIGSISSNSLEAGKQKHMWGVRSAKLPAAVTKITKCLFQCKTRVWGIVGFPSQHHGKLFSVISSPSCSSGKSLANICPRYKRLERLQTIRAGGSSSSFSYGRATWPLSWPCNCETVILESRHDWKTKPIGTLFLTSRDESFGSEII